MKKVKLMCIALLLLASIPTSPAWARGGHHGGGGGHHGGGHHGGHHGGGHHGHHHGGGHHHNYGGYGLGLGLGVIGGYGLGYYGNRALYYPPAYGYAPRYGYAPNYGYPVAAVPAAPPVYIQQQEVAQVPPQARAATNYWHYCRNPEGYYPYVKNCPDGWMQVAPQPSPQ